MIYFTGKLAGRQAQGQRLYSQVSAGGAGRCILPDFTVNFELNAPLRFYDKFSRSEHLRTKKEVMIHDANNNAVRSVRPATSITTFFLVLVVIRWS